MKFSYIAVCQKFRKVPPRDRRRQAHRGSTASARCTLRETASSGRALRFQIPTQLPFSPLPSFVWFLPPFAPRALPRFSATMASADCSPALTEKLSPGQVQNLSPRAVRLYRSEEHTSELQSPCNLVCRLLLEKKKNTKANESSTIRTNKRPLTATRHAVA